MLHRRPPRREPLHHRRPAPLDFCFTRRASPSEADWIERRLRRLCAPFGTTVDRSDDDELLEVFA